MISEEQSKRIEEIYRNYRITVKPLIAVIEAAYERFPIQIFNEIRALFDHIAHCYSPDAQPENIEKEITRSESHLYRIIFDCFKFLNVKAKDELDLFEKQTRNVDLPSISNGEFYPEYKRLANLAFSNAKEAKKLESSNKDQSLKYFEDAYNTYIKLQEHIESNRIYIVRAKWKFRTYRLFKIFLWFLAAVISGFISLFFTCPQVVTSIKNNFLNLF
ncbi:MAG TPA: hypothetical protein PLY32_04285 [Salinivirgaceae bacterium]|nr:hypothetical protein [Salinivirgaceae bacterium]HQA76321.1 hypothetical protein [Salinivirgaceae bacterium]